jgi:hypothetical protein
MVLEVGLAVFGEAGRVRVNVGELGGSSVFDGRSLGGLEEGGRGSVSGIGRDGDPDGWERVKGGSHDDDRVRCRFRFAFLEWRA